MEYLAGYIVIAFVFLVVLSALDSKRPLLLQDEVEVALWSVFWPLTMFVFIGSLLGRLLGEYFE